MVFLGLVLAAAAVAIGVGVVLDGTESARLSVFGENVPGVTEQWQVFLAGAVVAIVFVAGMTVTFAGVGRFRRTRRDLRYLREEHAESLTTLEAEKRQLQQELARIRQTVTTATAAATGTAAAPASAAPATAPPLPVRSQARSRPQISAASPFFDRAE